MRKIALEEHFLPPDLASYGRASHLAADRLDPHVYRRFEERLSDFGAMRLAAMDDAGIDVAVLSVTTPGVQAEPDAPLAIRRAKIANDFLAREIQRHPKRYAGFAPALQPIRHDPSRPLRRRSRRPQIDVRDEVQ